MIDPGLALQGAVVAAARADAGVTGLVGDRIYDRVPDDVVFPYVAVGEIQVIDDGFDCTEEAAEVWLTLHLWSRAVGKPETAAIAEALRAALVREDLALGADWTLVEIKRPESRIFLDVDGRTTHGVMTLRALVDPVS